MPIRTRSTARRAVPAALAAACIAGAGLPATTGAAPVITGAAATATRYHPQCPREWCLRVSFRAFEPDQYRDERLRWRVLAYRFGDDALVGNWHGRFRNDARVNVWWMWPTYRLTPGTYVARLVVVSGRGTRKTDRYFRVTR